MAGGRDTKQTTYQGQSLLSLHEWHTHSRILHARDVLLEADRCLCEDMGEEKRVSD